MLGRPQQVRDLLERAMDVGLVPRSARVFLRVAPGRSASLDLRVVPKDGEVYAANRFIRLVF